MIINSLWWCEYASPQHKTRYFRRTGFLSGNIHRSKESRTGVWEVGWRDFRCLGGIIGGGGWLDRSWQDRYWACVGKCTREKKHGNSPSAGHLLLWNSSLWKKSLQMTPHCVQTKRRWDRPDKIRQAENEKLSQNKIFLFCSYFTQQADVCS